MGFELKMSVVPGIILLQAKGEKHMKTVALGQVVDTPSQFETLAMTIDENSTAILMRNLTNLYSNPNLAVFREYVSNAIDSHVKAGINLPIDVSISGYDFVVKDYGVGMTKQEIVDIYSRYGSSTKRDTNTQIGAFGLGAKSALAISDEFHVVSISGGVELRFFVKKNNQGVGVVHFVSEKETTESNGVEIRIPLSQRSVDEFYTIAESFFKTWKPNTVRFNGELNSDTIYDTNKFLPITSGGEEFAFVGINADSDKYGYQAFSKTKFIIGGIAYTIENRSLTGSSNDRLGWSSPVEKSLGKLVNSIRVPIYIKLPIGSADLTPSREELMFTDKTVTTIENAINDLISLTPIAFEAHLNTLERNEVIRFFNKFNSYFGDNANSVKWQGETIPSEIVTSAFEVASREGSSMADPKGLGSINLVKMVVSTVGYTNTLLVKSDVSLENAESLRKNLRDYASSKWGNKNVLATLVESNFSNPWLDLVDNQVSLESLIEVAKEYRKNKRSESQVGVSRSKTSYAVLTVGSDVEMTKATADVFGNKVLYVSEARPGVFRNKFSDVKNLMSGYRVATLSADEKAELKSVFSGYQIAFLPENRSVNAFLRAVPHAQEVNVFVGKTIEKIVKGNESLSTVYATLQATGMSSTIVSLLKAVDEKNLNNLVDPVVREVALELKNPESKIIGLVKYANGVSLENANGVNLTNKFSILSGIYGARLNPADYPKLIAYMNLG
jgi:hypothetical protein